MVLEGETPTQEKVSSRDSGDGV
jgi:OPA family glycerol-3-phosphate transporter-like MFS transporter 3